MKAARLAKLIFISSFLPYPPTIANLVFQDTIERIYVGREYGDIPRGIYVVRGENVVLVGEVVSLLPCRHSPPR